MTDLDLDALRRIAEAAELVRLAYQQTVSANGDAWKSTHPDHHAAMQREIAAAREVDRALESFSSEFSPSVGLALLDRIATARRTALEEAARLVCEYCDGEPRDIPVLYTYSAIHEGPRFSLEGTYCKAFAIWRALAAGEEPQHGPRGTT